MKKRIRKKASNQTNQIGLFDMKLHIGDKLFKDGLPYGEIVDMGETLYFIKKWHGDALPNPHNKEKLIENILLGILTLDNINYE